MPSLRYTLRMLWKTLPIGFDIPINAAGAVAFSRKYFGPTHVDLRERSSKRPLRAHLAGPASIVNPCNNHLQPLDLRALFAEST
jgi:hypothetical protein